MNEIKGRMYAYAPASIGNVSVGFDVLGAALAPIDGSLLGDQLSIAPADTFRLKISGPFADKLPADSQQNIVVRCYHYFAEQLAKQGRSLPPLELVLHKHLPIGSGLGSSASSVVVALYGLNQYCEQPFDQDTLLHMMGEMEGQISGSVHYDNVAPSLLGGICLMSPQQQQPVIRLPEIANWYWVMSYSGVSISTAAARDILPTQVSRADAIHFGQQLAVFVDALHRQHSQQAAAMLNDVIAEPHRQALLPGFVEAKQAMAEQGALAFGISGSGPTVFALCDTLHKAEQLHAWLVANYHHTERAFSHICQLDQQGARLLSDKTKGI